MKLEDLQLVTQMKASTIYVRFKGDRLVEDCAGVRKLKKWFETHVPEGLHGKAIMSNKLDGRYVQGYVIDYKCFLLLSGGQRLRIPHIEKELASTGDDFFFEAELIYGNGLLGQRAECAITSTWLLEGEVCYADFEKFTLAIFRKVPILNYVTGQKYKYDFHRPVLYHPHTLNQWMNLGGRVGALAHKSVKWPRLLEYVGTIKKHNKEGLMLMPYILPYAPGKRLKTYIKIKPLNLVEAKVIDYLEGEGKFLGRIGSLVMQDDQRHRFSVASIPDSMRSIEHFDKIKGRVYKVQYESYLNTYVQPRFYKQDK